jgi:hypothetical protein
MIDANLCVEIARDQLQMIPIRFIPKLKETGFTIDPHPSLLKN